MEDRFGTRCNLMSLVFVFRSFLVRSWSRGSPYMLPSGGASRYGHSLDHWSALNVLSNSILICGAALEILGVKGAQLFVVVDVQTWYGTPKFF